MTTHTRSAIAMAVLPTIVPALLAAPRTGQLAVAAFARDAAALAFAVADAFVSATAVADPAPKASDDEGPRAGITRREKSD